ncbi:MAG: putative PEP-binding protein [Chloroflexota bacterium]
MTLSFQGIPAAPGMGLGHIVVYRTSRLSSQTEGEIDVRPPSEEWQHFLDVQSQVDAEITHICQTANPVVADIFSSQLAILYDPTLVTPIQTAIHTQNISAVEAVCRGVDELVWQFRLMEDEYFSSRATDLLDIGMRLIKRLEGQHATTSIHLSRDTILVAEDLVPSDLLHLLPEIHLEQEEIDESDLPTVQRPVTPHPIAGIALVHGSPVAHLSILARTLDIPMICALPEDVMSLREETKVLLDGDSGILWLEPSNVERDARTTSPLPQHDEAHFQESVDCNESAKASHRSTENLHDVIETSDHVRIALYASVNSLSDAHKALGAGADGIGLLRTEFLFHSDIVPPTVERHMAVYEEILMIWRQRLAAQKAKGETKAAKSLLTIRAMDIGGDKPVAFAPHLHEVNPALGNRGMRLLLQQPELLEVQIRAVLRVTYQRGIPLRFMLPMVTDLAELEEAREIIQRCQQLEGLERDELAQLFALGVLVETPAAALMATHFAPKVDFLAIGANDLTQYTLAVDRSNRSVQGLVDPLHPAVLKLISLVCEAGAQFEIPVGLCGGPASDPSATPLLLGLGITEFSTTPASLQVVRAEICRSHMATCQQLAANALTSTSPKKVKELLNYE